MTRLDLNIPIVKNISKINKTVSHITKPNIQMGLTNFQHEFISTIADKAYSLKTKKNLFTMLEKITSNTFFESDIIWNKLAGIINNQTDYCDNEEEILNLVKKIKLFMQEARTPTEAKSFVDNLENAPEIILKNSSEFRNHFDAAQYLNKMILAGIVPTDGLMNALKTDSDCVLSLLNLFMRSKFRLLNLDERALTQVLNNSSSNIRRIIMQELSQTKDRAISMKTDRFNPEQYQVAVGDRVLIFDKHSERLLSRTSGPFEDMKTQNFLSGKVIQSKYSFINNYGALKSKTTIADNGEKIISFQASEEGQFDVFRINGNKIEVLSRAIKNPINGELVIKQNLQSPTGIKTESKFVQKTNGNSNYTYSIKSKMNIKRTFRIVDENNFISTVNGKHYEVNVVGNMLNITVDTKTETIDLKKLVPSGDKKIISMLKQLPGDELIKIKKSKLKKIVPCDDVNCSVHKKNIIMLGSLHRDNAFVFLHELGHCKALSLSKNSWDKIIKIYRKELAEYKKNATSIELNMIDYIIENSIHYLNHRHGAIEEVLSDVNALLKTPCAERDIAERVLVLQEMFPETIAKISEYL